jgi:Acetyltransferase (GNAT) family
MQAGLQAAAPLAALIEKSEQCTWLSLWRSVSQALAYELGMHCEPVGSGHAFLLEKVPMPLFNRVIGLGIGTPLTRSDIDRVIQLYAAKGLDCCIALSPVALPEGAAQWLEESGFEVRGRWAKMHRGSDPPPAISTDLRIEQIDAERADTLGPVACAGFGLPPALGPVLASLARHRDSRAYAAFDGEQPVAVGVLTINRGVGHLNTAATLPAYRRRGAQGAIIAARIRDGIRLGCSAFATETGLQPGAPNPSYDNMRRFGFEVAYERPNYVRRRQPGSA